MSDEYERAKQMLAYAEAKLAAAATVTEQKRWKELVAAYGKLIVSYNARRTVVETARPAAASARSESIGLPRAARPGGVPPDAVLLVVMLLVLGWLFIVINATRRGRSPQCTPSFDYELVERAVAEHLRKLMTHDPFYETSGMFCWTSANCKEGPGARWSMDT